MKFTLSWLKDHLETEASVEEIAEALTDLGLEVEGVENPAARLRDFTIGRVTAAEKHPDADKLRVCTVETGQGTRQIICGAPNARAGITVVVAQPGTYVPGIDTTIQTGRIRGIESQGMMCSEREMELSDEHDGIIELGSGEVGDSFADWLAANRPAAVDPVIEIAITPNRPDALGVHGIARDLAARGLGRLKPLARAEVAGRGPAAPGVTIAPEAEDGALVFMGRRIRGVRNGPSPDWLQARLKAIGLRPISALVDITNFFTFDRNRPLHVFDAGRIEGDLRIHRAAGGEPLAALDERDYLMPEGALVFSDAAGVVSIGGIMGGARTGVSEETTEVLLEAAVWNTVDIAAAGRALKIHSDARYRNERGIDPAYNAQGLDDAAAMILEICGGEASEVVQAGSSPDTSRAYRLDTGRVQSLVGMEIAPEVQRATLQALGFRLEGEMAHVPSWRPDVQGEADLVEEVARIASLSGLIGQPLARPAGVAAPVLTPMQQRERLARRSLAALGYNECVTYSFIDREAAALFGGGDEATMLANPISSEMSHLRPALLPGLLRAAARNQARGVADLALFELGAVFSGGEPGEQRQLATGLLVGQTGPRDPHGGRRAVDVFDAKADAEAVLAAAGAPARAQILRDVPGWWHPGQSGRICLGPKKELAVFGAVHPRVLRALGVKGPAVAFTVEIEAIPFPKAQGASRGALELSDLQAVTRDFAFVVDARTEAAALVQAAQGADKALIADVAVFDVFAGEKAEAQMGAGKKSVALSVTLQPRERTLSEKDIEAVAARIIDKVAKATGAALRG